MKYSVLVGVYERLEVTSKRLEKTFILSEFLKHWNSEGSPSVIKNREFFTSADDLDKVMLLVQGRVFPNWDQRELGMAARLLVKALSVATGASLEKIESVWKETGDLGMVASELTKKKSQVALFSQPLIVQKVFDNLQKIAEMEGSGTVDRKVQLVAELLTSASPAEAKYIVRTILGELRVGLGEGTVRDSIVWAFFGEKAGVKYDESTNDLALSDDERKNYDSYVSLVQEALDVVNDFGEVAKLAKEGVSGLQNVSLKIGKPVKVMLFQKAKDIPDAFENVGKPAACEYKYDGFRLQIHKFGNKIKLFTRRLEDVTVQFPDVVQRIAKNVKGECIIDAEVVGLDLKSKKYLPFQSISQRIKRKYDIEEMARKFPVEVDVFDVLFCDGKNLLKVPFIERRKILEKIVAQIPFEIKLAEEIITDDDSVADEFYKSSLSAGNEGIMMKNLEGIYKPGSRVGFGMKVKPTMDTLEVVIVGAERGEGKRGQWLASFVIAVRDPETNEFVEVGRVGTGIKEKVEEGVSFEQLTQLLQPLIVEEKGREVKVRPEIVIEVDYEEIQKSPTYSSGFALRFPRLVRLRIERGTDDISSIDEINQLYQEQRNRSENSSKKS